MYKRRRILSVFLVMVILFSAMLTIFSTASAAGPDNAVVPTGDWDQLDAGESRWYAFEYAGDGSQIQVRLQVVPESSAGFVVWTPEQIYHWGLGEYVEPIGRGSPDPFDAAVLTWSGSFNTSGTYYVVVERAGNLPGGNAAGTSYYLLEVVGSGVSLSKSTPTPAAEPVKAPTQTQAQSAPPADPTGKLVFQTTYGGPFYTINVDGGEQGSPNLQRITNGIDPVWSPDGKQIAFVRWEEPRGVWVVDVETGNEWRAFDWSETRYPSWSPDGNEIVFSRVKSSSGGGGSRPGGFSVAENGTFAFPGRGGPRRPGPSGPGVMLGIVNLSDGAFREPLPTSDTNLTPDWSPDGDSVVFAGYRGLMVQSVDGAPSTDGAPSADGAGSWQLTSDPKDTSPIWSPDGQQVAFVRRQHDHWEVYVVNVTTGQQTRLTDTPVVNGVAANSVSPAWSPDGNYIAFLTDRSGEWEIWVIAATGGAEANGNTPTPLFVRELDGLTLDYAFAGERAIDWTW